jgi:GAF domain-containing protein
VRASGYHAAPMKRALPDRRCLALGRAAEALCRAADLDALLLQVLEAARDLRYDGDIDELRAIRSAVLAPLLIGDRLLGVLSLDAVKPNAFDEGDMAVLVVLAALTALAIDNARLQRDLYRQVQERTATLAAAATELSASLGQRDKLVDALTEALTRVKT